MLRSFDLRKAPWAAGWHIIIGVLVASRLQAQTHDTVTPLSFEALLAARTLAPVGDPAVSPDGSVVAYTAIDGKRTARFDAAESYRSGVTWYAVGGDIWVSEISGRGHRDITGGRGNNWAPSWSPDGRRLAFLSDRMSGRAGAATHLWVWDRGSGKLRQVSELPVMDPWGRLGRLEWLADNRTVVVKAYPAGLPPRAYAAHVTSKPAGSQRETETGAAVRVFQFDPTSKDSVPRTDPNNLDTLLGELALVDVETGATQRISGSLRLGGYRLSPDRRKLVWAVAARFARAGSYQILTDLVVYDLESKRARTVATEVPFASGYPILPRMSWSPGGDAIAYRTDGIGARDELHVVSLDGRAPQRIADGPPIESGEGTDSPLWDRAGQHLFFVRAGQVWRAAADGKGATQFASAPGRDLKLIDVGQGQVWSPDDGSTAIVFTTDPNTKQAGIARMDLLSGKVTQLLEEDKFYSVNYARAPQVLPNGKGVLYAAEDARHPPDLWLTRVDRWSEPEQVSNIGAELAGFSMGRVAVIEWRTLDGDTLHGALVYPAGYRPGIRYPMVVKVYGGTNLSDDANLFGCADSPVDNLQLFASRGYAVFLADSKLAVGTPMLDLLKSVMPGVDRVVELGVADPARIGITGHSYGGYSTLSLIVQSHRFRAAVMRAGFGDLVSVYARLSAVGTNYMLPWAERGQGRMGGTPWEVRERYIENSPIFYLDRVQTPLLIIHGESDYPVYADEVFSDLRRLGKRVEYARYSGENHNEDLWSQRNQIDYVGRVVAWFDRYLKAGVTSPQFAEPPGSPTHGSRGGHSPAPLGSR